ncbi:hypothetical protein EYR40_009073 [Pleurotus pulmonarius]|nr:hypothetical protein EYR36_009893 [Pleurotus pulmonarius]KAF4594270.1 hypothetical protein EYR40_009073 [Pleurotus pulmonarius]
MARPLTSRPTDLVYFIYFVSHVAASLIIDLQPMLPDSLVPTVIRNLPISYVKMSNDPLIGGAMGILENKDQLVWFRTFLGLEMIFQLPLFILGARALWKDSKSIYIWLLIYGASTATTTLPCLTTVIFTPLSSSNQPVGTVTISEEQRLLLLSSYLPYFLLPLYMTWDMASRINKQISAGQSKKKA